jgi:protein O-GlcNAc transferase
MTIQEKFNLAVSAHQERRFDAAEKLYREILRHDASLAVVRNNLGALLTAADRSTEAIVELKRAIREEPNNADFQNNLGLALKQGGRLDEAAICFAHAVKRLPNDPAPRNNLGVTLHKLGRPVEAIAVLSEALQLDSASHELHNNLGNVFQQIGRMDDAIAHYRETVRLWPLNMDGFNNLGNALKETGDIEGAIKAYERAARIILRHRVAASSRLYAMHFHPRYDAQRLLREHRKWYKDYAQSVSAKGASAEKASFGNDASPERRPRVGYVSAELREHPVGRFLLPLLSQHDRNRFEIFCYSDAIRPDSTTQKLRDCASVWRESAALNDEQLAAQIRADRIDILVDLTMHMADSRLLMFARKPAPVQATYLAYPSTSGLPQMDYRLTDAWLDPPGTDGDYVEKSIRLMSFWCYSPPEGAPEVSALPMNRAGHVTFGCLNNFCKISQPTWETWAGILKAVPESRLVVHAHEGAHRERVKELLSARGVDGARVEFVGFLPLREYLGQYNRVDIGLDPFPYGGGTTTCDAMWMGVPTVTLRGKTAVGRGGVSLASQVGLTQLIADARKQYVKIAKELAGDAAQLAELRQGMRARMLASSLMDAAGFALDVENAYREMWRTWCAERAAR